MHNVLEFKSHWLGLLSLLGVFCKPPHMTLSKGLIIILLKYNTFLLEAPEALYKWYIYNTSDLQPPLQRRVATTWQAEYCTALEVGREEERKLRPKTWGQPYVKCQGVFNVNTEQTKPWFLSFCSMWLLPQCCNRILLLLNVLCQ